MLNPTSWFCGIFFQSENFGPKHKSLHAHLQQSALNDSGWAASRLYVCTQNTHSCTGVTQVLHFIGGAFISWCSTCTSAWKHFMSLWFATYAKICELQLFPLFFISDRWGDFRISSPMHPFAFAPHSCPTRQPSRWIRRHLWTCS